MRDVYLSVVVTSRNDDHGGDMLQRMECFISNLHYQTNRCKLNTELIIVEWNPPAERPSLKQALTLPEGPNPYLQIRVITVPPAVHQQYFYARQLGLFQMIAKNVGIRRAVGEFILATNIDILFSDECFDLMAARNLKQKYFYRTNRCDVPAEVMKVNGEESRLDYCRKNILLRIGNQAWLTHVTWMPSFMYGFTRTIKLLDDILGWIKKPVTPIIDEYYALDTYACGDFTMMSKKAWLDIEGYPEMDLYSIHVDTMGVLAAFAAGYRQILLKKEACIYHIDHGDGWDSQKNPLELLKFSIKRPCIDMNNVNAAGLYLCKNKLRWGINKPDWGYANEQFEEHMLGFVADGYALAS
jgi:hypothetical protein